LISLNKSRNTRDSNGTGGSRLNTSSTISSKDKIESGSRGIKWELSVGSGVNNSVIETENDPSGDSNSLTRVEVSGGRTLTQRGEVLVTNERLPFSVSVGLSVTVNVSSELGLIPKDSRRGGGGVGVNLKLTRESEGNKLNSVLGGIRSGTQRKSFTDTGDGILEGKLERS